jgi:hypothetical protein
MLEDFLMNYRNAKHISNGRIDCEIEHPQFGWIPYTIDPEDTDGTVDNADLVNRIGTDAEPYTPPTPPSDEEIAADLRRSMSCTKMQGILTLGETKWGEVLAYRNQGFVEATNTEPEIPATTWPEKMIIDSAQNWDRTSENIAFFGQLLNYDDLQMDALFIAAADVVT